MKILIVKLGSIGDIVHTLPSLAAMRNALPDAEISWVVERRCAETLRDNPMLDRLIEIDTKAVRRQAVSGETLLAMRQQLRRLHASTFDVAIDFQGLIKSSLIAFLSKAKRRCGFVREALREPFSRVFLNNTFKVPFQSNIVVKNLSLTEQALDIDVSFDPKDFIFPIGVSSYHEEEADKVIETVGEEFVILNPGAGWVTKQWSPEKFGGLADAIWSNLRMSSVITYGPKEEYLAESVVKASRTNKAYPMKLSLKGFYSLARRAAVYVGSDTGPMHLSVAAKTPIVGLFGPTEWWRNGSPYPEDICVERNEIDCRENCHRRTCSKWICMDIEVERVFKAVKERIQKSSEYKL